MVGTSEVGGGQRDRRGGAEDEEVTGDREEDVRGKEGTGREGKKVRRRGREGEEKSIQTFLISLIV